MIRRPDEYAHQNDSNAIVDELNVRGGRRVVANLNELYTLGSVIDKLQNEVTIVRVISEDKDFRLVDKNNVSNANGWTVNIACALPEIQVSVEEPVGENVILWGKLPTPIELTDLDILRQIRDANPTSQLPSLWLDSEDPYTQWEGVVWNESNTRVVDITFDSIGISSLSNINKLTALTSLSFNGNNITEIDLTGLIGLESFVCSNNLLPSIPTLTSKGNIIFYNFKFNYFTPAELDRFRSIGFTDDYYLLPQNT